MKTFLLKLDNEVHKTWSDVAASRKMTLSEFIRSSVNAQLGNGSNGNRGTHDAGGPGAVSAPRRRGSALGRSAGNLESFEVPVTVTPLVLGEQRGDSITVGGSNPVGITVQHSPTCSCMLCASRKKKKPVAEEKPKRKFRR